MPTDLASLDSTAQQRQPQPRIELTVREEARVTIGLGVGDHGLRQAFFIRKSGNTQRGELTQCGHGFCRYHKMARLFRRQPCHQYVVKETQHCLIMMWDIRSQYVDHVWSYSPTINKKYAATEREIHNVGYHIGLSRSQSPVQRYQPV